MDFMLPICILVLVMQVQGQMPPSESYTHSAILRSRNILLYWKFDNTHITFEVIGQTTGWIGIGFSPNGAMTSSDIIVGWVKNGVTIVTDRHGVSTNTYPPIDPEQNINILGGEESDGWTMFKFSRQIAKCDAEHDREITTNTERLIWAYGDDDPSGDDLAASDDHNTNRGVESMYFLQTSKYLTDLPIGPVYKTYDLVASDFTIPSEDTYYNCKLLKLPDFGGTHHIVKWEPIIQPGNELYVHHMLIYKCGDVMKNDNELNKDARCYSPNMAHFASCTKIIFEWLIGAEAMIYPEIAGFPIGGPDDPVYVQLEIHYDNPNVDKGVRDSSGLRITYTPRLRENDIGVLQIGNHVRGNEHFIPPGAPTFRNIAHCLNECVKSRMTASGVSNVTAFSVVLHSHLAGRKMRLRHMRNGIELPYLANDETYDFNYQEPRYLIPGVTLTTSDSFQIECDYDTEGRTTMTEGGLSTKQEMCLAFVSYYPRIDLSFCQSSVEPEISWPFLGINMEKMKKKENAAGDRLRDYEITESDNMTKKTVFQYMNELNWTRKSIEDFEKFYNSAKHKSFCFPEDFSKTVVTPFYPKEILSPYKPRMKECLAESTTPISTTKNNHHLLKPSAISTCLILFTLHFYIF